MNKIKNYIECGECFVGVFIFFIFVGCKVFNVNLDLTCLFENRVIEMITVMLLAFSLVWGLVQITGGFIGMIIYGIVKLYRRIIYGKEETMDGKLTMTNKEIQEILKTYPDDEEITIEYHFNKSE